MRERITVKSTILVLSAVIAAVAIFYSSASRPGGGSEKNTAPAPSHQVERLVKIEQVIKKGDTIINVLKKQDVPHQTAYRFFSDIKPLYNLENIAAGKKFTLFFSSQTGERKLEGLNYQIDLNRRLEVKLDRETDCYAGRIITIPYQVKREFISGEIQESLFASILDMGERAGLADIIASLYEYDIDFNRDLRKRDSFALLVEKMYLDGKFVGYGHVLACEFTNQGNTIRVVRYTDPGGKTAYYHPDGKSVKKMFLRCPLPFMRVTSGYGSRRHPLLGFSARHNGIDLGAPVGTKIRATAPGIIKAVGYDRSHGKGRFISIRHKNRYVTHYYHLSRFGGGIRRGARVTQGQVIGYVGRTGWSTGPHLHYGMQKGGRFFNPLRLKSPPMNPVKKIYLERFKQYAARVFLLLSGSRLANIPRTFTDAILDAPLRQTSQPLRPVKINF
jgi:murein DD-endopeptidase MepM/ murein hydrolase activator NlpD